jgi:hypothetical protein
MLTTLPSGARTKNLRPPRLRSQRMNDFEATSLRLLIGRLDLIADMNKDDWVDRRRCVSSD